MNEPNLNQASKALDPSTEQLINQVVQALLKPTERGECRCHWLDPTKTPILAWKSAKDPNTLVLKISQQKFIGLTRSDKNNEMYWKFRDFYEAEPTGNTPPPPTSRKEKVETPPKSETESEQINFPAPTATELAAMEQSEEVKKFREKYGTPSNSEKPVGT